MDERKRKCTISANSKVVEPCTMLAEVTEGSQMDKRARGVIEFNYVNVETFAQSRKFYGVKSGQWKNGGMAFNFCPFCGTQIDAPFHEDR